MAIPILFFFFTRARAAGLTSTATADIRLDTAGPSLSYGAATVTVIEADTFFDAPSPFLELFDISRDQWVDTFSVKKRLEADFSLTLEVEVNFATVTSARAVFGVAVEIVTGFAMTNDHPEEFAVVSEHEKGFVTTTRRDRTFER